MQCAGRGVRTRGPCVCCLRLGGADGAFAAIGCEQLEWGRQAARIFAAAGYAPASEPFHLCFDAAKVTGRLTWDQRASRWVGQVDFNSRLSFDSWQDMETFLASKVAAGYVLVFLLCPLNPCVPSLAVPVGILPTDLKYTSVDLARWVGEICAGLTSAGFGHVLPTMRHGRAARADDAARLQPDARVARVERGTALRRRARAARGAAVPARLGSGGCGGDGGHAGARGVRRAAASRATSSSRSTARWRSCTTCRSGASSWARRGAGRAARRCI